MTDVARDLLQFLIKRLTSPLRRLLGLINLLRLRALPRAPSTRLAVTDAEAVASAARADCPTIVSDFLSFFLKPLLIALEGLALW